MPKVEMEFRVNGASRRVEVYPMERLLDVLREEIGLDYLLAAPLSHKTFSLLTEKILPRLP